MGELNKRDAEEKRLEYLDTLTERKKYIREDFEEMDFDNADQRDAIETYIEELESEYATLITTLNNLTFE